MAKLRGRDGGVLIGEVEFCVKGWDVSLELDTIEVTDTCSDGFSDVLQTTKKMTGSFTGYYYGDAPPTVDLGDEVDLTLLMQTTPPIGINIPVALVKGISYSMDVMGAIEFTIEFENRGAWTMLP